MGGLGLGFMTGVVQGVGQRQFEKRQSAHLAALEDRKLEDWGIKEKISQDNKVALAAKEIILREESDARERVRRQLQGFDEINGMVLSQEEKDWLNGRGYTSKEATTLQLSGAVFDPEKKIYQSPTQVNLNSRLQGVKSYMAGLGIPKTDEVYQYVIDSVNGDSKLDARTMFSLGDDGVQLVFKGGKWTIVPNELSAIRAAREAAAAQTLARADTARNTPLPDNVTNDMDVVAAQAAQNIEIFDPLTNKRTTVATYMALNPTASFKNLPIDPGVRQLLMEAQEIAAKSFKDGTFSSGSAAMDAALREIQKVKGNLADNTTALRAQRADANVIFDRLVAMGFDEFKASLGWVNQFIADSANNNILTPPQKNILARLVQASTPASAGAIPTTPVSSTSMRQLFFGREAALSQVQSDAIDEIVNAAKASKPGGVELYTWVSGMSSFAAKALATKLKISEGDARALINKYISQKKSDAQTNVAN